jgi:hypothetical protein
MMPEDQRGLLQAPPQSGHNGAPPDPPDNRPVFAERPCPECLTLFKPRQAGTLFCCPAHRDAWNNRQTVRGRVLVPLDMVSRLTRGGTRGTPEKRAIGKRAASDHHKLTQRYRDEDRAAGRMDFVEYLGRRYEEGFDPK